MVQLDRRGRAVGGGAAFDHVRVERALREIRRPLNPRRLVGEALDECLADPPALLLRFGDAGEHVQKAVFGRHDVQVGLEVVAEFIDHRRRLVFTQQAVVHEDAGKPVADGSAQQRCHDGRIDAAGESADHALIAHPILEGRDRAGGEVLESPGSRAAAGGHEEIRQHRGPGRRVGHLRMKLQAVDRQRDVPNRRERAGGGAGERAKVW